MRSVLKFVSAVSLFSLICLACGDDDGAVDSGTDTAADATIDATDDTNVMDGTVAMDTARDTNDPDAADAMVDAPEDTAEDTMPPASRRRMWISVGGETRLAVIDLEADGTMTARPELDLTLPRRPTAMTFDREGRRLFVGLSGDGGAIATITLAEDGRPSLAGVTEGTGNPVYLEITSDARLLSTYFGADLLLAHDVSGAPPHAETARLMVDDEPHQILLGPSGTRAYVPHRNGNTVRYFDLASGIAAEGSVTAEPGVGPRHLRFAPSGEFAYLIHEYTDAISTHRVEEDGSLTRLQTTSTIPGSFDGAMNTCADVHVTPDGRFVYGSNRGHDSLAMFAVQSDGTLSRLGTIETEARPREFDVSPDGRFVVVAGQDSGQLQSYRVEPSGTLTRVARLAVGSDLRWVVID